VPVRVRAVLRWVSGSIYDPSFASTGIFLDSISFTNCEWATSVVQIEASESEGLVRVDAASLGAPPVPGDSLKLRLSAELGGVVYISPEPLAVTFGGAITDFNGWVTANYPTLTGGFDGDPDRDGIPSGVEYAFGLSPIHRSRLVQTMAVGPGSMSLSSPLDQQRPGVLYQLERSTNLSSWTTSGTSVNLSGGNLTGSAPLGLGRGFVRWKIVEP
jgi:hypothetical protein